MFWSRNLISKTVTFFYSISGVRGRPPKIHIPIVYLQILRTTSPVGQVMQPLTPEVLPTIGLCDFALQFGNEASFFTQLCLVVLVVQLIVDLVGWGPVVRIHRIPEHERDVCLTLKNCQLSTNPTTCFVHATSIFDFKRNSSNIPKYVIYILDCPPAQ